MTAALRVLLVIGVVVCFGIGGWAQFAPESFYFGFPTVDLTPPYSEHLVRDYGGATLGLGIPLVAAIVWPETKLVIVAAAAYLVFAIPHSVFHFHHLDHATSGEAALIVTEMIASLLLPAAIVVIAVVRMRRERPHRDPALG